MSETTVTGTEPRTNTEAPLSNNFDDGSCATCGNDADGIDARDGLPTCGDCATLQADGGLMGDQEAPSSDESPARLSDLTAFQRDVLWVLHHEGPFHGLGIKSAVQEYYGENVNHGRLYPNLDKLVEMGLLEKGTRDQRTNEYSLTDDGRRALQKRVAWTEHDESEE